MMKSKIRIIFFVTLGLATSNIGAIFFGGGMSEGGSGGRMRASGLSRAGSTSSGNVLTGASVHGGGWEERGSAANDKYSNNRNRTNNNGGIGGFGNVLGAGAMGASRSSGRSSTDDDSNYVGYEEVGEHSGQLGENYQHNYEMHENLLD
jgi:hypothetical protein